MNFKNMLERFNDMESTTQASILTESTDLNAVNEGEERPYVCVHAKKGKHECHASSSYEAAKKAADHWGLKSTSGIDAHLADVKHVAEGEEQDREDSDQHTPGQTRLPFDESLKDIFEKLSGEMLNENTISMKPSQTIEKDGKPVGVVQDPNLATQLQRGLEQGTVSFDDELSEDLSDISDEANELMMYAENNRNLYNQSYLPIVKNLEKKFKKGTYDGDLAVKLWKYHADRAAKAYGAEHGGGERDGLQIFDPNTRREVAAKFAEDHFAEMEAGNFHEADDLREQSEMMGSSSHKTEAARLEGKSHALRKENYNCKYDEGEEAQAYHEGYKEGLDQLYSATPDMSMPMIAEPEAEPELSFGLDSDYADDLTFESWDNELQTLLNKEVVQEAMNVSISKGLQGVPDQLTVTAQDSDVEKLMAILKQSEVGLFSDTPHSDYGAPEHGKDIGDHDQMMALMKTIDDHSAMGPEENMVEDEHVDENAFNTARDKAIAAGHDEFKFDGKIHQVTNVGDDDVERATDRFGDDKLEDKPEKNESLWDNIHAKRERIKRGSGERMRRPGEKGAPTDQAFKDAAKEGVEEEEPPFDADPPRNGPRTDQYGNVIKHVARHLARKGRAEAEADAKKDFKNRALSLLDKGMSYGEVERKMLGEDLTESVTDAEDIWVVRVPANVYDGKYYDQSTVKVVVPASAGVQNEQEAISWVNNNKEKVLAKINRRRPGGKRIVGHPVADNVFFKDSYYVTKQQRPKSEAIAEKAPPGMEDWIMSRKKDFKDRYGDKWQEVLYATAWKKHNEEK